MGLLGLDPREGDRSFDIGSGHRLLWLDADDLLWKDPNCTPWHRVDVTSGTHHKLMKGGKGAPPVVLKIEGSLLCTRCGAHGFVVDGRWVEA